MLAAVDEQVGAVGDGARHQHEGGLGNVRGIGGAAQQVQPAGNREFGLGLVVAGQDVAGAEADQPVGFAQGLRQHGPRCGMAGLADGVGEEIRVEVRQLLVEQVQHPAAVRAAGMGKVEPRQLDVAVQVRLHHIVPNGHVRGLRPIGPEHAGVAGQRAPVGQARGKVGDHGSHAGAIGQFEAYHFGAGQAGGQRRSLVRVVAVVDHHVPAACSKPLGDAAADPVGSASDKDCGAGHGAPKAQPAGRGKGALAGPGRSV